jgi:cyclopropane fatty-acyl-phospholipid synthase-like methyltransferase
LFAAIEHFSSENGARLLRKICQALEADGVLVGSTPIFEEQGFYNPEHDNEFFAQEQLRAFLVPHFEDVEIWTSRWPSRTEGYFRCRGPRVLSDSELESGVASYDTLRASVLP